MHEASRYVRIARGGAWPILRPKTLRHRNMTPPIFLLPVFLSDSRLDKAALDVDVFSLFSLAPKR